MPRRNKSLKMLNFGGYKRRSSKRGGGFLDIFKNTRDKFNNQVDILKDSAKKASDATKLAIEGNPTHPKHIAHKVIIDALPDKVAKLEERVIKLEVDNNTVTGEPVEEDKHGGRKRKTRRRRQSKKLSKKSRKLRKSRKSRKSRKH